MTYQATMSLVDALIKHPPEKISDSTKSAILKSYLSVLKKYPNWYRPPYCVVYKIESKTENYFEKIN